MLYISYILPLWLLISMLVLGIIGLCLVIINTGEKVLYSGLWGSRYDCLKRSMNSTMIVFLIFSLIVFSFSSLLIYVRYNEDAPVLWFYHLSAIEKKIAFNEMEKDPSKKFTIQEFIMIKNKIEKEKSEKKKYDELKKRRKEILNIVRQ